MRHIKTILAMGLIMGLAWGIGAQDDKRPSGSTALVHDGKDSTEQWMLVRLQQNAQSNQQP